jgi:hypothetical protein
MEPRYEIMERATKLQRIDTHCHLPSRFSDLQDEVKGYAQFRTSDDLQDSKMRAIGCRELYGIDPGMCLQPDAPAEIWERAAKLRAQGFLSAFETALDKSHIASQLVFCDFRPEASPLRSISSRVKLIAFVDDLITADSYKFCPDGRDPEFNYYGALCSKLGDLVNFDQYLETIDRIVDSWRANHVVAMKVALAYSIGLSFGDPSLEEARSAFEHKRDMTRENMKTVQDYAFRHSLLACLRNDLPVVIHTGFQIWGRSPLSQSNPSLIHNLLTDARYRDLTFVLLHGGNPFVGETTYLAGMFPQVIIDFTWIAWMSRIRFRNALAEWLQIVPNDRFCWGSDSSSPETIVGIDFVVREEIGKVLADLLKDRIIDPKYAHEFLENTYVKTPKRVFGL